MASFCRRGALAGGEDEGKQGVEPDLLQHTEGVLELLRRLPGEAHDDVGGEDDIGDQLLELADFFQILRPGVAAVHHLEDPVVPRLEGQVEHRGHLFALGHSLEELLSGILGVGGHKPDEKVPRGGVHLLQ